MPSLYLLVSCSDSMRHSHCIWLPQRCPLLVIEAKSAMSGADIDRKWTSVSEVTVFLHRWHNVHPMLVLTSQHCPLLTSSNIRIFSRDIVGITTAEAPEKAEDTQNRTDMGLKSWDLNNYFIRTLTVVFHHQGAHSEAVSSVTRVYMYLLYG